MGVSDSRPVVLLADDDAITSNLAPFLERAGFTVHVAANGDAALELVERLDPDGCVLDVLNTTASPSLVAGAAGLFAAAVVAVVLLVRHRGAEARAAATETTVRQLTDAAAGDRLRFLMRLDHELKNPLTAIRAGLVNIEQTGGAISDGAALATVSVQTDRITRLVSDLRKLAELETRAIEAVPVDLTGLLREVAEAAAEIPGVRQRGFRMSVPRAPWPLPLIEGDRDLLFIAVQNLVANAIKFSSPGDTVEVRASKDDHALLLEVADTGAGIPADEIGQVWPELARGRAARSLPGTGIGLALVRVIVTRHGGQVAIRSREGQGTVVSIRLPIPDRASPGIDVAGLRHRRDTPGNAEI